MCERTISKKLFFVVEKFLTRLGSILKVGTFDDGINRAGLLAETTEDAFRQIDIVARGSSASIRTRFSINCDRLCWTDRLAQLASNATLLAGRVAAKGVLATETRAERAFLERIIDGDFGLRPVSKHGEHATSNLRQEQRLRILVQPPGVLGILRVFFQYFSSARRQSTTASTA